MSLRDRLSGRPRRTTSVRLPRGDLERLRGAVLEAAQALHEAETDGKPTDMLSEALVDARAAVEAAHDVIDLQALPPAEFETLQAEHTDPDGELDVPGMRPHLLAACSVDESLRDAQWWAEQIAAGAFTAGDMTTLWVAAYQLNASFGSVGVPKG